MRDHRLDNAKALLIFMVVFGHLLEAVSGWEDGVLRVLLSYIYMFHMPAFVFLAGMTAKTEKLAHRVGTLLVLLVSFQVAYTLPSTVFKGVYPVGSLQPYWMLWFLMAMVWWLVALPLVKRLPAPLLTSILIALLAGVLPWVGYPLGASRTLVFLPFFVAGHLYGRRVLAALPSSPFVLGVAPVILFAMALVVYLVDLRHPWLNGYASYQALGLDNLSGVLARLGLLVISSVAVLTFLMTAPSQPGWMAKIGASSMAVFLLHGFFVKLCRKPLEWVMDNYGGGALAAMAWLFAVVITALLGRASIDRAIRKAAAAVIDGVHMLRRVRPQ